MLNLVSLKMAFVRLKEVRFQSETVKNWLINTIVNEWNEFGKDAIIRQSLYSFIRT